MGLRTWAREHLVSADAIYGLILYTALIGVASDDDASTLDVIIASVATLVIFWGAHVFAGTIAGHGIDKDGNEVTLAQARRKAVAHSSRMLYAAILPTIALLPGLFHLIPTDLAVDIALLVAMIVLGVLGYQAFAQRGVSVSRRIFGGIGTAFFGLLIIILNSAVH